MTSFFNRLQQRQKQVRSVLCLGLDPDPQRMPKSFHSPGGANVSDFLMTIVDGVAPYCCCVKPQIAHFSAIGMENELSTLIAQIQAKYPDLPVILDAKRGDIGSTADHYTAEAFHRYKADAVTVNPYMGEDSVMPFAQHKDKGVFVLCRTSNPGASAIQNITVGDGEPLYMMVARKVSQEWNGNDNLGLVVGATALSELRKIRERFPESWLLVPGIGAQGGDLSGVIQYGKALGEEGGLVVNSSRSILYASSKEDFLEAAQAEAKRMVTVMQEHRDIFD